MSAQSSVALRHLGSRAVLLGTGDAESLQNIDTTNLDDGALCYVTEFVSYFMLDKASAATPEGNVIIQPASGPGRWFFLIAGESDSALWAAYALSTTPQGLTIATVNVWVNPPAPGGAVYSFSSPGPDLWVLDTATGLITYNGVSNKAFDVTVNASVASATGAATSIEVVAALAGLVGTTSDDFYAGRGITAAVGDAEVQLSSSKIMIVANGDIIRPVFRNVTSDNELSVERLSVVITAVD